MSPVASDTLAGVLDHVTVTRYVTPLREGGSLPALVEADNLGTYVMKFRGAGQGPLALVAEIIAGELARRLGLRVPDLVLADLDPRIPGSEPDPEIQDLLRASEGLNLAVDFLPGSVGFDPLGWTADPDFASRVLWFDALVRTSTAPGATRTCSSGTATSGSSTTGRRCTSTTTGRRPTPSARSTLVSTSSTTALPGSPRPTPSSRRGSPRPCSRR